MCVCADMPATADANNACVFVCVCVPVCSHVSCVCAVCMHARVVYQCVCLYLFVHVHTVHIYKSTFVSAYNYRQE